MPGISSSEPDIAFNSLTSIGTHYKHPVAAGILKESTVGDEERAVGISQGKPRLDGLAAANSLRLVTPEQQINFKLTVVYLWVDFADGRHMLL